MDEVVPHMVVAAAGKNGEGRDKVEIALFKRQSTVDEVEFCCTGTDVIYAHIPKTFDHIFPVCANIEICSCFDVQFCGEEKVVEIFHGGTPF